MASTVNGVLSTGLVANLPAAASNVKNSPEKIAEAARQFEGLLIGQMFKAMHQDAEEGWLGTGEDQTASSAMDLADEYLAQSMAQHGGFGLAEMISRQLTPAAEASQPAPEG